jgi:glyoxylase-like metal-dependent hydrolase (beta-lactamase superfamily II)
MASQEDWEMKSNLQPPDSKHFRLQQLADGVYAAIHIDGGAAIGNAGIIDLGDRTLIYDTFSTPQAAEDLRTAAETLTARAIDAVINSHWHHDHIWGNQVFSSMTKIISTEETRRLFNSIKGGGIYDDSYFADAKANLEATRTQFKAMGAEGQRRQLALWIDYYQSIFEAKPILQVRAPNLTFTERLVFHGTDRTAELIAFVGGHSESDAVLFLPQERIAFMGDLLCIGYHPYLVSGDPERFCHGLDAVTNLAPKVLVPGHGPVGMADNLTLMRQYIQTLDGIACKMVEDGETEGTIEAMAIPEPYDDWLFASFFSDNLHFLYQSRLGEQGDVVA